MSPNTQRSVIRFPDVPSARRGLRGRRTSRHTTHHRDYPKRITIVRPRHPFEGQTLETLAWVQRRGVLYANVILSDGTRVMLPATWTDYAAQQQATDALACAARSAATLASISELLHAHAVVAPMLARIQRADAERVKPQEVEPNATTAELGKRAIKRTAAAPKRVADALERTAKRNDRASGPSARKGRRRSRRHQDTKGFTR
jgi:hypothetical protein